METIKQLKGEVQILECSRDLLLSENRKLVEEIRRKGEIFSSFTQHQATQDNGNNSRGGNARTQFGRWRIAVLSSGIRYKKKIPVIQELAVLELHTRTIWRRNKRDS
jgi:hypothetical protein